MEDGINPGFYDQGVAIAKRVKLADREQSKIPSSYSTHTHLELW
ncbi:hypothetical protein [Iningainema tapete]|nr:hypothetical protein [Iningainema tapete]